MSKKIAETILKESHERVPNERVRKSKNRPKTQTNPSISETSNKTLLDKTKHYLPYPDFIQKSLSSISIFIPFIFLSCVAIILIYYLSKIGSG